MLTTRARPLQAWHGFLHAPASAPLDSPRRRDSHESNEVRRHVGRFTRSDPRRGPPRPRDRGPGTGHRGCVRVRRGHRRADRGLPEGGPLPGLGRRSRDRWSGVTPKPSSNSRPPKSERSSFFWSSRPPTISAKPSTGFPWSANALRGLLTAFSVSASGCPPRSWPRRFVGKVLRPWPATPGRWW